MTNLNASGAKVAMQATEEVAQHVPVATLQWSEAAEPNEQVRYTHVLAESPLGRFSIEWKSWKPHDSYCVHLDGDYLDTAMNLDDAKAIALKKVADMAHALAGYAASVASAPVAGEAQQLKVEHDRGFSRGWDLGHQHGSDLGFSGGVCVALQVITGHDAATIWREVVQACDLKKMLDYAANVEPDEWELAGFKQYARAELNERKPRKRSVPAAPQASEAVPGCLLAAEHVGMTVDYTGLLGQARSALKRGENAPAMAEMVRQLAVHLTELGQRWYAGDAAVVDEFLQLYCIESDARAALPAQPGARKKGGSDA
ncbi:hypothetical protein IPU70_07860 [Achromobacter sp. SD115]|uniref:hypothetical protein n=1 Tax=Achromobacter sp. SD115 TaxID=2782011 RepID=UPI001A95BB02|nr:hypothetical protein [Achromobacter sp. SD115]MBO1013458.1 hypothetical protein [Achromobacter sp. SD115]